MIYISPDVVTLLFVFLKDFRLLLYAQLMGSILSSSFPVPRILSFLGTTGLPHNRAFHSDKISGPSGRNANGMRGSKTNGRPSEVLNFFRTNRLERKLTFAFQLCTKFPFLLLANLPALTPTSCAISINQ